MAIFENFSHQSFDLTKEAKNTINNTTKSEWNNKFSKPLESKTEVTFWSGRAYTLINIVATPFRFIGEEVRGLGQIGSDICIIFNSAIGTFLISFEWVLQKLGISDTKRTFKQQKEEDENSVSGKFWATKNAIRDTLDHCGGCIVRIPRTVVQEIRLILGLINSDFAFKTPAKLVKKDNNNNNNNNNNDNI